MDPPAESTAPASSSAGDKLRALLKAPEPLAAPIVYDVASAKLAQYMGFKVITIGGSASGSQAADAAHPEPEDAIADRGTDGHVEVDEVAAGGHGRTASGRDALTGIEDAIAVEVNPGVQEAGPVLDTDGQAGAAARDHRRQRTQPVLVVEQI